MPSAPADLRGEGLDAGGSAGGSQAVQGMVDLGRRRGLLGQTGAEELLGDGVAFGGVLSVREALL